MIGRLMYWRWTGIELFANDWLKWIIFFIQTQTNKLRHGAWGMAFISNERKYLCMHECTLDAFHPAKVAVYVCSVFFLFWFDFSQRIWKRNVIAVAVVNHSNSFSWTRTNRCRLKEKFKTKTKNAHSWKFHRKTDVNESSTTWILPLMKVW